MQDQIRQIAERIRELRSISDEDIKDVAAACGIKEEDYSLYESGDHDIPVGALHSIAQYFKVELTALLTGKEPHLHSISLTRGNEGVEVNRRQPYKYLSLAYGFADRKAQPFLVSAEPKSEKTIPELNTHPGQEFNYVLRGKIKLFFDGREYILEKGDSAYYDSNKPHGMQALDSSADFLAVIF